MKINSISASRQKTYDTCKYKYLLTYLLYQCLECNETFYDTTIVGNDRTCSYCKSKKVLKVDMRTNWGAVHGTALHWILEEYANACRGHLEDGTILNDEQKAEMLDWEKQLLAVYKRGHKHQNNPSFSILDIAKNKEYADIPKECQSCPFFQDGICDITNEEVDLMKGCPKRLYDESYGLLQAHFKRMNDIYKNGKILGVEAAFDIDFGIKDRINVPIKTIGFMDFVYESDKQTVEMIDYKFGAHTQTYDEVYNDIQARLYSLALKSLYPGYDTYILTFDYMRGQPVSVTYTENDDNVTKQKLVDKWNEIVSPQPIERNIGWWCKAMCDKPLCDKEWPKFIEKYGSK